MQQLDDVDKKILFELGRNCRRSSKEIAKKLKLKRDTVAYRVKQLEKAGTIKGYYSVIDASKLGYSILIRIYIKFQGTTLELEKDIVNYLLSQKETFTVYKTEGDWDLVTGFFGKSFQSFNDYYFKFKEKYRRYIYEQKITAFTEFVEFNRNYLVDKELRDYSELITGKSQLSKVDETDLKVLRLISQNAKIPLLDVANELGVTSMAARYRIKELERKKILLAYRALLDLNSLGYEYYKVDLEIEDVTKLGELYSFAKHHPNIVYVDKTISESDFEFDAELENYDAFYNLIEEIKKRFPGIIRTFKHYKARKIYRFVYLPE